MCVKTHQINLFGMNYKNLIETLIRLLISSYKTMKMLPCLSVFCVRLAASLAILLVKMAVSHLVINFKKSIVMRYRRRRRRLRRIRRYRVGRGGIRM